MKNKYKTSTNNRTNTNITKQQKLEKEYVLPIHNILYKEETIPFLKSLLKLLNDNISVGNILYSVSYILLGFKLKEFNYLDKNLHITIPDNTKKENDLMGTIYQYLSAKNIRLAKGSFYTSNKMIEEIISHLNIKDTDVILDPACGSGNLLFNSKITKPEQIIGIDNDELAILCCITNYYIKFKNTNIKPQIYKCDFGQYISKNKLKVDYILCNPPYGANIDISAFSLNDYYEDSLEYFIRYSATISLKKSIYILPENILNIKKYTNLRKWILSNSNIESINSYGSTFSGTMFPIISLILNNEKSDYFYYDNKKINKNIINKIPFNYIRPISKEDEIFIDKIFTKKKYSLSDSIFALGIVTGNNKEKLLDKKVYNSEPIITGKDITKYKIKEPSKFIIYDRNNLQQVAPDNLYRNDEKIVYKTVSRNMNFAIDTTKSLTLNSANFFIKRNIPISSKCLIGLLNSQVYEKLNKLLYGENKIGRINLENLPIPYIDENIQIMIEKLIDDEKYDEIDKIISQIFDL